MLEQYFTKCSIEQEYKPYQLGSTLRLYDTEFPKIDQGQIAIIGVVSKNTNEISAIRHEIYSLVSHPILEDKVIDLGNVIEGETPAETHKKLKKISESLISQGVTSILLGTSLDQGEAQYQALQLENKLIETSLISSHLPLLEYQILNRICNYEPNYLQTISALAFQSHYIPSKALDTLENLNFGHLRLGALKSNTEDAELLLRNSSLVMFDLNAIKHSDAPGTKKIQPNGLTGEEACQLSRYSGISDATQCFGIFEYEPSIDEQGITAKVIAQMVWYFLDGYANRSNDAPDLHNEFVKYRCDIQDNQPPILFLKSKRTNRWWMQIEHPAEPSKTSLQLTFPCSYMDYQMAANGELPLRYMNAIKRLQ